MVARVHWLLHNLETEFKGKYQLIWKYENHSYTFYRMSGKKLYDVFIVVRTSKRCFRVSYANSRTGEMQTFSCKKSSICARRMWYIYKIDEQSLPP